jgi:transposase
VKSSGPKRLDVNEEELNAILERARVAPLTERDYATLKASVDTLSYLHRLLQNRRLTISRLKRLVFGDRTEKTRNLVRKTQASEIGSGAEARAASGKCPGHGRNGAADYPGAERVSVNHPSLRAGDCCPACRHAKVYASLDPAVLVRVVGRAPLQATVYAMEQLRCGSCGQIFSAEPPAEAGAAKYDASAAATLALLKYGTGVPFHRLERLQESVGVPLPASTQWEIVSQFAAQLQPAREELERQAAQGRVAHNDDTRMKVLELLPSADARKPSAGGDDEASEVGPERTGVFTSGIVSLVENHKVALFFTGRRHAGENLTQVLRRRDAGLAPLIQMCDALSRNVSKEFAVILANCIAHARRQFVDVASDFPHECRFVLETLRDVYKNDALAREQFLSDQARLAFHQEHSRPLLEKLRPWMREQIDQRRVEPNSGLGDAIGYMLDHWPQLTRFLEVAGAPLDNNICERALKRAILHRKNSLFFKTRNGARVGDLFMTLIHTCHLNGINPLDYLTELHKHASELSSDPCRWMPWNYRQTVVVASGAA